MIELVYTIGIDELCLLTKEEKAALDVAWKKLCEWNGPELEYVVEEEDLLSNTIRYTFLTSPE